MEVVRWQVTLDYPEVPMAVAEASAEAPEVLMEEARTVWVGPPEVHTEVAKE